MSRYEQKYYYTLEEAFKGYLTSSDQFFNPSSHSLGLSLTSLLTTYGLLYSTSSGLKFFPSYDFGGTLYYQFIDITDIEADPEVLLSARVYKDELLYMFFHRYYGEYVYALDEELEDEELSHPAKLKKASNEFLRKFMNLLMLTYKKYTTLLKAYNDEENQILGKLHRTTSGEIDNTGTQRNAGTTNDLRKDNDTPQGSGDFSDDTHTSFISKGTSDSDITRTDNLKTESSTSEEWDSEYLMDKLKKIQDSYRNVMLDWLNEFSILFIQGGNVYEI